MDWTGVGCDSDLTSIVSVTQSAGARIDEEDEDVGDKGSSSGGRVS
jgi:hypothetical protein